MMVNTINVKSLARHASAVMWRLAFLVPPKEWWGSKGKFSAPTLHPETKLMTCP